MAVGVSPEGVAWPLEYPQNSWLSEGPDLGVLGCNLNSVQTFNLLGIALIWPLLRFPTHPTFQPWGHGCSLHMALGFPPNAPSQQ